MTEGDIWKLGEEQGWLEVVQAAALVREKHPQLGKRTSEDTIRHAIYRGGVKATKAPHSWPWRVEFGSFTEWLNKYEPRKQHQDGGAPDGV